MTTKQVLNQNLTKSRTFIFVALGVLIVSEALVAWIGWNNSSYPNFYNFIFLVLLILISIFSVLLINALFKKMSSQSILLENVLDSMSDGIVVVDQNSNFILFNKAAEEMIGSSPSYKEKKNISEHFGVFYADRTSRVSENELPVVKALHGIETKNLELFICNEQKPEGIFLNVNAKPLRDENGVKRQGIATFQDITEKFNLNEELKKKERLFYGLFEFAPDAIISVNENGKINLINSQAEILFGYSRTELLNKEIEILIPEKYRNRHAQHRSNYQKDPKVRPMGASGLSLVGRKKDGAEFPLAITLGPVSLENQSATLAVIRDITAEKQSEETIKNLNAELESKLQELEYVNKELKAFSYSVSHDLRAPLRSMIAFSKGILEENQSILPDEAKRKLNKVLAASERMGSLVDALLTLAQISRQEPKYEDVDLAPIVRTIITDLEAEFPDLKIEAQIIATAEVRGDPDLLYIMLKNLLTNATKFSSKKDVVRIEFGVIPGPDKNTYFIKDNGAGFEMSYAKNLFQDFERLHHASEFEGTGIGLSSTRRIIEKHGGKIWAESKPGEGAIFYFQI